MSVEVRNLQSGETYAIGNDGAVFGREGGGAAIQVADRSVSKKHARIFTDGTEWFLEDMGSVNGTIVDGAKIGGAVPLRAGLTFSLSKFRFEIARVPAPYNSAPDVETRTSMRKGGNNNQDLASELRKDPVPRKRRDLAPPRAAEENYDDDYGAPAPTNRNQNLQPASDNDFPPPAAVRGGRDDYGRNDGRNDARNDSRNLGRNDQRNDRDDDHYGDDRAPQLGIDQYEDLTPAEAVATGIGYVLKQTPLLALNPVGTVRKHIEEPPLPPLEKIPLAALVFPTLAAVVAVQQSAAVVATMIGGSFPIVGIILVPVLAAIGGAILAVAAGFLSHPVLSWIVDKLGGQSDTRTRTAHVGIGMVAGVVLLVPGTLTVILTALIARLMTVSAVFSLLLVIPALIAVIATPLPFYIQWQFFKSYGVAKWFQTLWLVLAVLLLVFGLFGTITTVIGAVKAMTASGPAVVAVDGTPPVETPDAPDAPKVPETPDATPPVNTAPNTTPPVNTNTNTTPPVNTAPNTTPPVVPVTTPPANTTTNLPSAAISVDTDYATYERKRTEIEALLERDPTLVTREPRVKAAYETLLQRSAEAEQFAYDKMGKKRVPGLGPSYEKQKKAEVYDKTKADVSKLHRILFGG